MNTLISGNVKDGLSQLNQSSANCRTALFNLVIYTHDSLRIEYCNRVVEMVSKQFPCRIFFIESTKETTGELNLNFSVLGEEKGKSFSSDFIHIKASGEGLTRVPYLIIPYLIPDLPIFLLWDEDITKDSQILSSLRPLATRIIYDSESMDDLKSFTAHMMQQLHNCKTEIIDMNWVRIAGWREVIAKTFDTAYRFDLLKKSTSIDLVYNDRGNELTVCKQTQAYYLQAWIASRLKWKWETLVKTKDSLEIHYTQSKQMIIVRLIPGKREDLAPEEIIDCRFSNPSLFECTLSRQTSTQVQVHASDQYQCVIPFNLILPTLQSGRSFIQEIFYQKINPQYPEILPYLSWVDWRKYNAPH